MHSDIFTATFIGQFVEIVCSEQALHPKLQGLPLTIEGYFVDADLEYIYLGGNPLEINMALKRDKIVLIAIAEQISESEALLREMPVNPEDAQ